MRYIVEIEQRGNGQVFARVNNVTTGEIKEQFFADHLDSKRTAETRLGRLLMTSEGPWPPRYWETTPP